MAGRGRRLATGAIVGIAIAGFLFIAFWVLCCYCCCFRNKRKQQRGRQAHPVGGGGGGMFSRFMPGRQRQGPAMMESGYGHGHGHHGIARPAPSHGYR
ncbi:hypothetical protein CTA2_9133 [Colletotrichum tanaceti]|uniref:Uncharacterized protein n=1 Tax=Colletotrichum tanaceti TaxID=1306861 RepID=A0A4U6XEM3_9PEZI|nr:hypothetical protein CTA2_9133 [Colletotrichum tanaceti]TKW53632.1 hypothetical protein CTA1_2391 [Colletotrichum tanaceti]